MSHYLFLNASTRESGIVGNTGTLAQPMLDTCRLCAAFRGMHWQGVLWGSGGAPDAVLGDVAALAEAARFVLR